MPERNRIIVFGDWFIDENWVIKEHISHGSFATGENHYIVDNNKFNRYCPYKLFKDIPLANEFNVKDLTDILQRRLDNNAKCEFIDSAELINLSPSIETPTFLSSHRIIRTFQKTNDNKKNFSKINELKNQITLNPNCLENKSRPLHETYNYFLNDMNNCKFRTEQVYIGVSLLIRHFGKISQIEQGVLHLFHDLFLINGIRSLDFFIYYFRNIKNETVKVSNAPDLNEFEELKRHIILPPGWNE